MKKALSLLLAFALVLHMSACGFVGTVKEVAGTAKDKVVEWYSNIDISVFERGWNQAVEFAGSTYASAMGSEYVRQVANAINTFKADMNSACGSARGVAQEAGFAAEKWVANTFDIDSVVRGSSEHAYVVDSNELGSVDVQEYDGSLKAVKNFAYVDAIYTVTRTVADKKTGTDVEITTEYPLSRTVGTATGRARREVYVDAGDVTKDDANVILTATQRNAAMDDAGKAELVVATEAFTADVDPYGNLKYKTDYDLGDIVTVDSRELGMRVNARITEIKEIYEGKGLGLELALGYGIPSFAKQVRWLANG